MKNAVSLFAQIAKTYWQHKKILLVFVLIQCAVDTVLVVISRLFGDTLLSFVPDTQNLSQLQSFLLPLGFTVCSAVCTALWSSLFMLIPLSLIFSKEYPNAVSTKPFLLSNIPDILRILGMLLVMQIIPTITTYVIPTGFMLPMTVMFPPIWTTCPIS